MGREGGKGWHHLAEQPYTGAKRFNTLAGFRTGHPSFSTKWLLILGELIYILNGLPALPLRVAIVIFILHPINKWSDCSLWDLFDFLLESLQQGFSVSGQALPFLLPRGSLKISKGMQF